MSSAPDSSLIKAALSCKCPQCKKETIYKPGLTLEIRDKCPSCGLALSEHDSGDGPAVFLIFILGFLLVPMALWVEFTFSPPLWFHAVLWSIITLGMTIGALRPIKSYIIALQFKHRPDDWDINEKTEEKETNSGI